MDDIRKIDIDKQTADPPNIINILVLTLIFFGQSYQTAKFKIYTKSRDNIRLSRELSPEWLQLPY